MDCQTGPVDRRFGDTDWIVYSCEDHKSAVFVSKVGNPASPFYFILFPKDGKYELYGEGNGDKQASDKAGDEIAKLSPKEIGALIEATEVVATSATRP
jgi:hypothetical protein